MNQLTPFQRQPITRSDARLPKVTRQAVEHAHQDALVAAARVAGRAFVTQVALNHVVALSYEEEMYSQQCPHAAGRFSHIVDTFAMSAANEIRGL